jgi:hypothetical protein
LERYKGYRKKEKRLYLIDNMERKRSPSCQKPLLERTMRDLITQTIHTELFCSYCGYKEKITPTKS